MEGHRRGASGTERGAAVRGWGGRVAVGGGRVGGGSASAVSARSAGDTKLAQVVPGEAHREGQDKR